MRTKPHCCLAYAFPYRRFAVALADGRARLRVDADRYYSFIVSDLHRILHAGLPGALRKILYVVTAADFWLNLIAYNLIRIPKPPNWSPRRYTADQNTNSPPIKIRWQGSRPSMDQQLASSLWARS